MGERVLGKGVRWWRDMQDPRDHLPSGGERVCGFFSRISKRAENPRKT